jgi:Tol biopolymer transport system component
VRPLKSLLARPIEGTEGAQSPFWSPDSRNLGFFAQGRLKKVAVGGGAPELLCAAPDGRGGTWGSSGVIVFAPVPTGPLSRISAEGGPVSEIAWPDSARHETALRWPVFLSDGRHFAYVSLPPRAGGFDVYVSAIGSRRRKLILHSDAAPVVAGNDRLILVRNGRLMVQRFDFGELRPIGDPISLGPSTATDVSVGEPLVSASMNGVLIQQNATLANTQMVWLDRSGRQRGVLAVAEGRYERMSFSPDGRRLLVIRRGSPNTVDLWAIDLASGLETRLTSRSQSRIGGRPSWSPDGRRVAFNSNRDGPSNIYEKDMDQNAPEKVLYQSSAQFKEVDGWSHDGRFLLFVQADPATAWDLWLLPMTGDPTPIPYLRTSFNEFAADVSPDGKWLAYWSDESGTYQVYVQSFPTPGEKHLVSSLAASGAVWSKDGRELLLYGIDATLWSVPVSTVPTFRAGTPRKLFKCRSDGLWMVATPDLNRFLLSAPAGDVPASTITVELNWSTEATREERGRAPR